MQDGERRSYEMLARGRDFYRTHADSFPAGSRGSELFAELDETIREIDANARAKVSNMSAAAQGTANRRAARESLRALLEAISRTARAMALDIPGLDKRFQMPRGNSDQSLLATAHDFLANAEPLKAEFIRNELPATFHDDLRTLISEFEGSITTQNQSRGARVSATKGVKTAVERGVAIVRRLDAIVRNKFAADPASLAEWTSATHVERAPRRAKTKAAPDNNPPPPQ